MITYRISNVSGRSFAKEMAWVAEEMARLAKEMARGAKGIARGAKEMARGAKETEGSDRRSKETLKAL